jgi:hypothetical protein
MSAVTVDQVRAILTGTETRNMKNPYRVSLAVRDSWLEFRGQYTEFRGQ